MFQVVGLQRKHVNVDFSPSEVWFGSYFCIEMSLGHYELSSFHLHVSLKRWKNPTTKTLVLRPWTWREMIAGGNSSPDFFPALARSMPQSRSHILHLWWFSMSLPPSQPPETSRNRLIYVVLIRRLNVFCSISSIFWNTTKSKMSNLPMQVCIYHMDGVGMCPPPGGGP